MGLYVERDNVSLKEMVHFLSKEMWYVGDINVFLLIRLYLVIFGRAQFSSDLECLRVHASSTPDTLHTHNPADS